MRRNGYLWTSGVNLHTVVRFADPDFLLECKISAIQRRFPFIFAFYMLNVRHISTSGFLTYWPRKYTMSIIPTRSEVDMTIHCRVVAFLSADMSWDLWPVTLTFDLLTLNTSHMAGHVINLATSPIRCWVMITIENAYAATEHAPNHMTRE